MPVWWGACLPAEEWVGQQPCSALAQSVLVCSHKHCHVNPVQVLPWTLPGFEPEAEAAGP